MASEWGNVLVSVSSGYIIIMQIDAIFILMRQPQPISNGQIMMIIVAVPFMTAVPNMEQPLPHNLHIYRLHAPTRNEREQERERERSERWKTEHSSGQMTFQSKWNEKECHALMSTHTEKKHTHKFCIWLCGENTRRTKQTKETEEQNGRVMHVVLLY